MDLVKEAMEDIGKVILKELPPEVAAKVTPPVEPPNSPFTHKAAEDPLAIPRDQAATGTDETPSVARLGG